MDFYRSLSEWSTENEITVLATNAFWDYMKSLPENVGEIDYAEDIIEIFSYIDKSRFSLVPLRLSFSLDLNDPDDTSGAFSYTFDLEYAEMRIGSFTAVFDPDINLIDEDLEIDDFKLVKKFCKSVKRK
ncbi:MAG: hypothetical protein J5874_03935 [Oscillospiraceae bacterium]|nr:hypothetical protein [Oscillospiraceae bacterium]